MSDNLDIIKELVDSLTGSLTSMLIKIESLNPILDKISDEVKDNKVVDKDTSETIKDIKRHLETFYDSFTKLPDAIKEIKDVHLILVEMNSTLDEIKKKTDSIPELSTKFSKNNSLLTPISKLASWITTPIGIIASLCSIVIFILGTMETIHWFIGLFPK